MRATLGVCIFTSLVSVELAWVRSRSLHAKQAFKSLALTSNTRNILITYKIRA